MTDKYTISLPTFDECLSANGRYEVNEFSPMKLKDALERFARYFKAEFRYDNVQYKAEEHNNGCIGFLFTESAMDIVTDDHAGMPTRCSGGCCFRKEKFADGDKWVLYWIWLHPYFRNKEILSKHWGYFQEQYGDFMVWPPISRAMQSFIDKQ